MKRVSLLRLSALLTLVGLLGSLPASAQTAYTLQEAVDYAIQSNLNIKNSQLDAKSACLLYTSRCV